MMWRAASTCKSPAAYASGVNACTSAGRELERNTASPPPAIQATATSAMPSRHLAPTRLPSLTRWLSFLVMCWHRALRKGETDGPGAELRVSLGQVASRHARHQRGLPALVRDGLEDVEGEPVGVRLVGPVLQGAEGARAIAGQRGQDFDEDLTRGIFGCCARLQAPVAVAIDRREIAGVERSKGRGIDLSRGDELCVVGCSSGRGLALL